MMKTGNSLPFLVISVTRFHCMTIGALAAILFYNKQVVGVNIAYSTIAQVLAWFIIGLLAFNKFHIASVIDTEIVALVAVVLIVNVSGNPSSLVKLRGVIPNYLGKISYGLYVYHPLVIFLASKLVGDSFAEIEPAFRIVCVYALIVSVSIIIAGVSYQFFEKRFLLLKSGFSEIVSSANERN